MGSESLKRAGKLRHKLTQKRALFFSNTTSAEMASNKFPLIVPASKDKLLILGLILVKGRCIRLKLSLIYDNNIKDAQIFGDHVLSGLMSSVKSAVKKMLNQNMKVIEFLNKLQSLLNESKVSKFMTNVDPSFDLVLVLNEIQEIGWNNVQSIDSDLSSITLTCSDPDHRLLTLNVSIPSNYPSAPLTYQSCIDLPSDEVNLHSIVALYDQFKNKVYLVNNIWSEIDKIERDMLIAEEEDFDPVDYKRCILIAPNVFMMVTLDAENPKSVPECSFHGPANLILKYQQMFSNSLDLWDEQDYVSENFRSIFGSSLISIYDTNQNINVKCGICLSISNNGQLPEIFCSNIKCLKPYHFNCLSNWLSMDNNGKLIGESFFGHCSYCKSPISCRSNPDD